MGERGAAGTAAATGFSLHQRFDAEAILGGPMHPERMQPERDPHEADGLALAELGAMTAGELSRPIPTGHALAMMSGAAAAGFAGF